MSFVIKQSDTRPALVATLKYASGIATDLSGASVQFIMARRDKSIKLSRGADISDAAAGKVLVVFTTEETNESGTFLGEFQVTYADGGLETFPNSGFLNLSIEKDLS